MSNPILSKGFENQEGIVSSNPMTISGTVNKTFLMFVLMTISFGVVFYQYNLGYMDKVSMMTMAGLIVGFILAMIIIFTRKAMGVLVPLYAFAEGAALGGISAMFNAQLPGIVPQAVALTLLTLFTMLALYKAKVIRATERFVGTIVTATGAIALFYIVALVMGLFGKSMTVLYSSSPIGIAFSVIVVLVAAANLIIDFDFIEKGAFRGLDRQYEWYGSFGLMVTLVWLYMEILRLLSKINNR